MMNPSIPRSFLQDFLQKNAKVFISQHPRNLSHVSNRQLVTKCGSCIHPTNHQFKQCMVPAVASSFHSSSWITTTNSTTALNGKGTFTRRSFSDNNKTNTTQHNNTAEEETTTTATTQPPETPKTSDENTTETNTSSSNPNNEVEKLQSELKEMKDQLLRSLAEQENIRRIAQRDVENARNFAVSSFAKSLLDTSDNLTRAMEAVPEEYRQDNEEHPVLATLYEGIRMTEEGLTKAFAKNGLKKFGERGDKFDPNMHDALFEYKDDTLEAGTVGQVMKVGFMLNNRVIRPAEVGVVKKS
jgi:molecular chaperone GrpE